MPQQFGDWHVTMTLLATIALIVLPLSLGLREPDHAASAGPGSAPAPRMSAGSALGEAFRTRSYLLLTVGFFVCGFHVSFIGLHLPSYIADHAVGMTVFGAEVLPVQVSGWAIGLVGLFNIVGAVTWGWLGGRHRRKDMLALLYAGRALAFLVFLMLPLSWMSVMLFAAMLGFLWLGTVPLTSGLIGLMFGPSHLSMLWGIVFFSHQLGSFMGGWLPGLLYDMNGNYDLIWWVSIALGLTSAALHWGIREHPVARLAPEAVPV
jgi:MFS family permease